MKKHLTFLKLDETSLNEEIKKNTPLIVVRNFFPKKTCKDIIKFCLSHSSIDNHRIKKFNTKTLILAVNPSVEGDATCSYIKQIIPQVSVERIGFGIPIGGSLEFLDPLTISKALENRKA